MVNLMNLIKISYEFYQCDTSILQGEAGKYTKHWTNCLTF